MQVLENAVRKLKMPARAEEVSERIEPRLTTVANTTPEPETVRAQPVMSAVPPPPPRVPLFSDLPEPEGAEAAPVVKRGGGGGGDGDGGASDADESERAAFGPFLTWIGAAAAVALVVGVSVWTYRLGQRDAMEVPIVAALEGPARVLPDDAGGRVVAHQGHSVNQVLEGQGVAEVASSVRTAPGDNDLTDEDAPQRELTALVASSMPVARPATETADGVAPGREDQAVLSLRIQETGVAPDSQPIVEGASRSLAPVQNRSTDEQTELAAQTPVISEAEDADPIEDSGNIVVVNNDAVVPAPEKPVDGAALDPNAALAKLELQQEVPVTVPTLDGSSAAEATPVQEAETEAEAEPVEVAALGPLPPVGQGSIYAPAVMAMPKARPADLNVEMANAVNAALEAVLNEAAAPASEPAVTTAATTEVAAVETNSLDTIPLPSGTRMIQIGAYGSEAIARQQWDRLSSQHSDLLGAKDHYVQRTVNSGKTFYRLRVAGYESKSDTRAACASLSARGLPCITVTLR